MRLAATEYERFLEVVAGLEPADWDCQTDNELWNVRAMLAHVLGMMEMNARVREMVRQQSAASKASKRNGTFPIDELTGLQVRKHVERPTAEIAAALRATAPRALKGRSRAPAPIRALPMKPGPPFDTTWRVGYMLDTILTRDTWMHRVDLSRATAKPMVLTAEHDGRIVADVVAEWSRAHGQPFTLTLTGPAGGTYAAGTGGENLELDAVEFCRILSGRATGTGLLTTEVPF